jgi:protein-L-isoaspartate(D-aspartate) O-methyltransferase
VRTLATGITIVLALGTASCARFSACGETQAPIRPAESAAGTPADDLLAAARRDMVAEQIEARGVTDPLVLAAMRAVPRHEFVPRSMQHLAYVDRPLPIGRDQTISQPYIVALMSELAEIDGDAVVLEVGTGSGYQAAVLADIARRVYSIEIIAELTAAAERTLRRLGYDNVEVRHGDGYAGWPEQAPFDAILVTAAPPAVPEALRRQLAIGGRLVIPVGERYQELRVITRTEDGFEERSVLPVRFVPMTDRLR